MQFDFESIIDRRGKDAIAFDVIGKAPCFPEAKDGLDTIPMWIADMNFATAPSLIKAVQERLEHPIFGYFDARDEYYDAIIEWQRSHHGVKGLEKKHIGYENGVLGGVIAGLNTICTKGDGVLVHTPTYCGFRWALGDNGYKIVESPLKRDEAGIWRMNFADMEKKIVQNKIHAAILCSPHNPCGRVWEKWELERAFQIFEEHDVYVVADEIWADLVLEGNKHIPVQQVNGVSKQRTIAMYAPTKTFNTAGLVGSYHIVYNDRLREQMEKEERLVRYNEMNVLSMYSLIGAFSDEGEAWRKELISVLTENVNYAVNFINENFDDVWVARPQGTYMLFVNVEEWLRKHDMGINELVLKCWECGVGVQDGNEFAVDGFIRMNLASPKSKIVEAMDRLQKYIFC